MNISIWGGKYKYRMTVKGLEVTKDGIERRIIPASIESLITPLLYEVHFLKTKIRILEAMIGDDR